MFTINETQSTKITEPLIRPFGFKGGVLNGLCQSICRISTDKYTAVSPCTESVLWSDAGVFSANSPENADTLMYRVTQKALELIDGKRIERPDITVTALVPELTEYADFICGRKVKETFVLNSLVGIDITLWSLYAKHENKKTFDEIIPDYAKNTMSYRHGKLAHIPLVSYNVGKDEIIEHAENGTAIFKIKIGNSVDKTTHDTDMKTMLEWDKKRLSEVFGLTKHFETPLTKSGRICYYLDANGRYDTRERMEELLDYADSIGMLSDIAIIEEPFDETSDISVNGLPAVFNADESAHSVRDLERRIALGYRSVALKPIAKTVSVSFAMADAMRKAGGMYLCADLTVNPYLAEWNKQFAARIAPLSSMNVGCVEVNGNSNYINWEKLKKAIPENYIATSPQNGIFVTDNDFFEKSGLLFGKNGYFNFFEK